MMLIQRAGFTGFFIGLLVIAAGCSSSDSGSPVVGSQMDGAGNQDANASDSSTDSDETPAEDTSTSTGSEDAGSGSGVNSDTSDSDSDSTQSPDPDADSDSASTTAPSATGSDSSGGDDDSPTATETLSLQGPFIKDPSRGSGPPSIPEGLTLLLSAENWLEFTWAPSTDDQSVETYEVYRDGELLHSIRGDSGYEFDYRSWISTSYYDCNYTRYASCEGMQPAAGSSHEYTVVAVDNEGMSSAHSDPAVFQLAMRQDTPVELADYSMVFDEEFDGSSLDLSLWKTALPWGPDETINGEMQYFVNTLGSEPSSYDPFIFTGDTLKITGIPTPADLLDEANDRPYLSGVLTTSDHFEMTYGYIEMRAKLAGGQGLLSTFYLFNQDFEKNKPEIDIIEYIGTRPDKAYQTYHYYDSNRARRASGEKHSSPTMETVTNIDLSADFHQFGVLWEQGLVVWYIDGVEVRRLAGTRVSDEPMNIITQLVIGSSWIGEPDASSIPAELEIDYIRAWQKM